MIPAHGLALSETFRCNKDEKWGKGEHVRIIELKETVTASNDRDAEVLRGELKEKGTLLINLMASPGAGKTTLLERTIRDMKDRFEIAVMEADVDSDVDENKCIGCGLCTTRCEFDAIHLSRDLPEASTMVRCEDKMGKVGAYAIKRAGKILFGKKEPTEWIPE